MHRRMTERIVRYGDGFNPLGRPSAVDMQRLRSAMVAAGRDMASIEPVGGTRAVFPDDRSTADLGQALELIPEQRAEGFTTFCIKPSQFTDDPDDVGRLCRDIVGRVSSPDC
jgi:hypothetical protein